ncbi:hypothetical protein M0802_007132 [Mischocyttarus mexicanus]|nr:hypothetical protein M0802_007132 [Mischocyttarus mexicanus]
MNFMLPRVKDHRKSINDENTKHNGVVSWSLLEASNKQPINIDALYLTDEVICPSALCLSAVAAAFAATLEPYSIAFTIGAAVDIDDDDEDYDDDDDDDDDYSKRLV